MKPGQKVPRNAPCPCGSGRKYKSCCFAKDREEAGDVRDHEPNMMTVASKFLVDRQEQYPIHKDAGKGRVEALFKRLLPHLPHPVRVLYDSRHLAVGEVAVPGVVVQMHSLGSDYVIEMSVAFMQFLYAVIRTLCGNSDVLQSSGKVVEAALTIDELVKHMESIFTIWKSGNIWTGKRVGYPDFSLNRQQIEIAEVYTLAAESFVLAHEIGHVMKSCQPEAVTLSSEWLPKEGEELWADAFATLAVLRSYTDLDPLASRPAYGGALLAVRVLAWLERMGHDFGPFYPPAEKRLKQIRGLVKSQIGDPTVFAAMSTTAEAFDQQIEAVEFRLLGTEPSTFQTPERALTRLSAMIEEYAIGRLAKDQFLTSVDRFVNDMPNETLTMVATLACERYILPWAGKTFHPDDLRARIAEELIPLISIFPVPVREIFDRAVEGTAFERREAMRTDALVERLNSLGYLPVFLPRTGLEPPEIYSRSAERRLVRRGPLAHYLPPGVVIGKNNHGQMASIENVETSTKRLQGAVSFLENALQCIGITSPSRLNLSFAGTTQFRFSFTGVEFESTELSQLDQVFTKLGKGSTLEKYVSSELHVVYEYLYAKTLTMRWEDSKKSVYNVTPIKIEDYIHVGASGKVEMSDKTTIQFKSSRPKAAFAYKAARLRKEGKDWKLYPEEIATRGFITVPGGPSPEKVPYLPARGVVLKAFDELPNG